MNNLAKRYIKICLAHIRRKYYDIVSNLDEEALKKSRAIKSFVIGRKNWLCANTGKGANSSDIIYSVIETAKSHGLSVEKYLVYLMDVLSNENTLREEDLLEPMPWSKYLPEYLKVQTK